MWTLRWQKLMQKHRLPSFFMTDTTALYHTLWLGHMVPKSCISHSWLQTSSTKGGGICQNHSLQGVSSVIFIMCSVEWVKPSSPSSSKKTSWYSTKSYQAESANSRGMMPSHSSPVLQAISLASVSWPI